MRGTKAKALRRIATNNGVLNRTFYKVLKSNKPLHQEPKAKPDKRRKPLPVAPRPGAKPIHLVRAIQQAQRERGWDDGAPGHWWRDTRISLSGWSKCNLIWRLKDIKESKAPELKLAA